MAEIESIRTRLEDARAQLLDPSLRNRMLNYRELKARGVEVVDSDAKRVLDLLAGAGGVFFAPAEEEAEGTDLVPFDAEVARLRKAMVNARAASSGRLLQTEYDPKKLYSRLLNTYRAARTLAQEQGTSNLFLALGMLEWFESEISQQARLAPLALLPVELQRTGVGEQFQLVSAGEDLQPNHSLWAKARDFSIEFPMFEADDEIDLEAYFGQVERVVASLPRWAVRRQHVALAFFSFSRYLMYLDLDDAGWPEGGKPTDHLLMQSLLGDGFREPPSSIDANARLDEQLPVDATTLVLDADSTQIIAAQDAIAGRNMVIQGPPGTGKSQTITNVIADAVWRGRRVLFVSEKMAALEVVKRRLESVGAGDAVLELHSNKARKKDVLEELRRTLYLRGGGPGPDGQTALSLDATVRELNAYCDAVNTPLGQTGVTPIAAFGHTVRAEPDLDRLANDLRLDGWQSWSHDDVAARRDVITQLQDWVTRHGRPASHPFWGSTLATVLPQHERAAVTTANALLDALPAVEESALDVAKHVSVDAPASPRAAAQLQRTLALARSAPAFDADVVSSAWEGAAEGTVSEALDAGHRLAELREAFQDRLRHEAWTADVSEARRTLARNVSFLARLFSGRYRRALRTARQLHRDPTGLSAAELLVALETTEEAALCASALQAFEGEGERLFGHDWQGGGSDFEHLRAVAHWRATIATALAQDKVLPDVLVWAHGERARAMPDEALTRLQAALDAYRAARTALVEALQLDEAERFPDAGLPGLPFNGQRALASAIRDRVGDWRHFAQFWQASRQATSLGLGEFVGYATYQQDARVLDLFERWWHRRVAEHALEERPVLADFERATQEQRVARLNELDQEWLHENRSHIAKAHLDGLPHAGGGGQLGVLHHEFQKRRRHLPIRRLMQKAGNAIQAIKPVLMMSPMSIAQFLPPGSAEFDLIVFDEASQVRPEDALGALLRGRQAVVVGDTQQLPPTDFFSAMVQQDDEAEDDGGTTDIESILGLFLAKSAPQQMLRWHYRSRHESLIAVSNRELYHNELLVFPSPAARADGLGLVFHHLPDTVYARGAGSVNRGEARAVAEAVMQHARHHPEHSLGVAAFSSGQATAIEDEVERLRRQHSEPEAFFTSDHPQEPFFVKNLETVQGDERDTIFISVGYGRDANGKITMNFGPVNRDGGERRLNVLITRAKRRCEVFSNITADDIPVAGTPRGVQVLRAFLAYAETGELPTAQATQREPDSPFEIAVADALRQHGHTVVPQVGIAGFFIDLGITDPSAPGRFLLGIECDGASYHSARSARDRDRLRQAVLEDLGWRLHRIWSTDWFRNPESELQRALRAIEDAANGTPTASRPTATTPTPEPTAAAAPPPKPAERATPVPDPPADTAPATTPYTPSGLTVQLRPGMDLHQVPARTMASWVERVVNDEGPVHTELVTRRILEAAGLSRAGNRIKGAVRNGVRAAREQKLVQVRDSVFLWPTHAVRVRPRDRSELPPQLRRIDYIAPEEIDAALTSALERSLGMPRDEAVTAAAQLLGFGRMSAAIREALETRVERLETLGEVVERAGSLVLRG